MDATAILVPVLTRPHRVKPMMESVAAATPQPHRLLFVAQDNDTAELAALEAADADFIVVERARRSYACKINDGARATVEPRLFLAADDLAFHPGWLAAAVALLGDGIEVVGTVDLCNDRTAAGSHSTHTLVTRRYIDECGGVVDQPPGVVLCERYGHDYVDDEFVGTAIARGLFAHAADAVVEHLHPNVKKAPDDSTYRLGRSQSRAGRRLFQSRRHLWRVAS